MLSPAVRTRSHQGRQTSSSSSGSIGSTAHDAGLGGGRRTPSGHGHGSSSSGGASERGDRDSAVRVVVRVRPQSKKEVDSGGTVCVSFPSEDSIELNGAKKTYDRVFDPSATQREVFDYVAKPLVAELFHGYNGTIFAYGQTSSGKTHTMEGPSIHDPDLAGVIPRTVREIFLSVAEAPDSLEFIIKVSYIEIYMEKIRDLLDTYNKKVNLPVREDKQRGVYVAGATEEYVTSADELIAVMATGAKNRVVAATGMNQGSSRSHSVFIISLQQRDVNDSSTKTGMLFLVDLAGSEMVKKTHATGQVLEEAKTINKSLSALGQVINALTDEKKPHVPYRDSKLTRVLQNSLGGNSKTCLIVNCSPSSFNDAETQSTLRFGSRAKRIQNKAVVNETRSVEELSALLAKAESAFDLQQTYISALEKQRDSLEKQMKAMKNGGGRVPRPPPTSAGEASTEGGDSNTTSPSTTQDAEAADAIRRLTERNQALQAELEEEKAEVKRSRKETNELRGVLQEREVQLGEAAAEVRNLKKSHAVRQEALAAEKADVAGELEALRTRLQEVMQAKEFENKERSLTIEKLTGENSRLADEIRELTGDAVEKTPSSGTALPTPARAPPPATSTATAAHDSAPGPGDTGDADKKSNAVERESERASKAKEGAEEPKDNGVAAASGTAAAAQAAASGTAAGGPSEGGPEEWDPAALESAGATEDVLGIVRAREQAWRIWQSSVAEEARSLKERSSGEREQFNRARQELNKRLADNEQHREQLTLDLQRGEQRLMELERAVEGKSDVGLAERERKQQVDIQKRLEQLVAVHRQLLRRYGGLELENSEYRKKIHLRNERMAQLQRNTELLSMTMKDQAERHVAELSSLREQVSSLHEQQQQQQQRERMLMYAPPHRGGRRIIRGGGGSGTDGVQEVKIIVGGGGQQRHNPEDKPWGGTGLWVTSTSSSSTSSPTRPDRGGGEGPNGSGSKSEAPTTPRSAASGGRSHTESLFGQLASWPSRVRSPSSK